MKELRLEHKVFLYNRGAYSMSVPTVQTVNWRTYDWIQWIDQYGTWFVEELNKF